MLYVYEVKESLGVAGEEDFKCSKALLPVCFPQRTRPLLRRGKARLCKVTIDTSHRISLLLLDCPLYPT